MEAVSMVAREALGVGTVRLEALRWLGRNR